MLSFFNSVSTVHSITCLFLSAVSSVDFLNFFFCLFPETWKVFPEFQQVQRSLESVILLRHESEKVYSIAILIFGFNFFFVFWLLGFFVMEQSNMYIPWFGYAWYQFRSMSRLMAREHGFNSCLLKHKCFPMLVFITFKLTRCVFVERFGVLCIEFGFNLCLLKHKRVGFWYVLN